MKAWAILLVRDEIDVLPHTLSHLYAQGLDGILVADNNSHDGTREYLNDEARAKRITLLYDDEFAWYQMAKMSRLANLAHEQGADWILPNDADEWFRVTDGRTLGTYLRSRTEPVIAAPIYNYFATGLDDTNERNPFRRLAWRRPPSNIPKVAFRWQANTKLADGNHALLRDDDSPIVYNFAELEMRHLCHRSEQHFVDVNISGGKALAATHYDESRGGHWRIYYKHYLENGEQGLRDWWREHFWFSDPSASGLIHNPIPQDAK